MSKTLSCLSVRRLTKVFRDGQQQKHVVFSDLSFELNRAEIVAVLGRSGCGKTSLLDMLAGFVAPDAGTIVLNGKPVLKPGPDKGVVFQDASLFPWMTLSKNVEFGLLLKKNMKASDVREKARRCLKMVGLQKSGNLFPSQASGGMKQRAALARIIALEPELMLMDEPFAALDAQTREEMQGLLLDIHKKIAPTILFVTHDIGEAVLLADRILLFGSKGEGIVQSISLQFSRPRDPEGRESIDMRRRLRKLLARPA